MHTISYQEKFEQALNLFREGKQPTEISKLLHMDTQTLRNNLRAYGYISNNKNMEINEDIFANIDNEEKAYWLGFLYADGYISKDSNRIGLTIKDKDHAYKFSQFLNLKKPIRIKQVNINGQSKIYYDVTFRNKRMHTDIKMLQYFLIENMKFMHMPFWVVIPKRIIGQNR